MATQLLVRRSTNIISLSKFRDQLTKAYPVDAVVFVTLIDENGSNVTDATGLPMNYVAGTTGSATTYRTILPSTIDLSGDSYTARITATRAGVVRELNVECTAVDG